MKYRLKSDPNVECVATKHVAFHPTGFGPKDDWWSVSVGEVQTYFPDWLFEKVWEPVPEPAPPRLIEEDLEELAGNLLGSEAPGFSGLLRRAAAEIRALRKAADGWKHSYDDMKQQRENWRAEAIKSPAAEVPYRDSVHYSDLLLPARAGGWPKLEHDLVGERGCCERCGNNRKGELGGHHVLPYHLRPDLELDPANIAVVCFTAPLACHFNDHLGDWRSYDPKARDHNSEFRARVHMRPKTDGQPVDMDLNREGT